jgi:signal transduction histidine kinase
MPQNFDLFSVGIAITTIAILGFIVFFSNRRSYTNRAFLLFSLVIIFWSSVNYLSYQFESPLFVLWSIRFVMFFAVWYSFGLFLVFFIFPNESIVYPKKFKFFLVPLVFLTSFLTLTPAVFPRIKELSVPGEVSIVTPGPGIIVFGIVVLGLIAGGIFILFKKMLGAKGIQKVQFKLILVGVSITFCLHIIFNFVLPVFFDNTRFIPLGAVFVLPFAVCTSFAIIRYHLLNIKIIATEILTFVLTILTFLEIIFSQSLTDVIFRVVVFLLVLTFGIFLIKSVRREVEQRERLEVVTKELQIANERLKELDQQKTDFLSIAAHQLRTPMSIMNGYMELISDGAYGNVTEETKGILRNMDQSNQRLIKLVDEFLDITRIEQGRTKFDYEEVDMGDLINSVGEELKQRALDKQLKLEWQKPDHKVTVMADSEKIRHVVFNFADNAIKYSPQGTINISLNEEKGGIAVRVLDQGFGFGEKDQHNFFQKFYRGDNVKKTEVSGTGLGLYVCRKFIENHKGQIWAKSPGLGQGSEFGFWIPLKNIQ